MRICNDEAGYQATHAIAEKLDVGNFKVVSF